MLIANPISDTAFKILMDDSRIARFFIETILEENISEVMVKPQEIAYQHGGNTDSLAASFGIFRLDFVATIKTGENDYKKVLIEIQKARKQADVMRFRKYLAEHYKKEDEVITGDGKQIMILPIVTIYLLGFNLPEVETAVVKINRQYIDCIDRKILTGKNDFIEKLTHDCFVVQIPRIEGRIQNKLDKLLSFFEQKYFIDEGRMLKEYKLPIEGEEMKLIAERLNYIGTDRESRSQLDIEKEAYRVFYMEMDQVEKDYKKSLEEIAKHKQELEEKEKALEEKEKALEEMAKELEQLKRQLNK